MQVVKDAIWVVYIVSEIHWPTDEVKNLNNLDE